VTGELFGRLNDAGLQIAASPVAPDALGELVDLVADGTLSGRLAKDVFGAMFETGRSAADIVAERGLRQVSDSGAIEAIVEQVLVANPDKVEEYRAGKDKLFGFFVGQVMKASQGKANPQVVNEVLRARLAG
jgi:aspartyl-tRNA(Asn)/glutamyl-tRNA(Gln) amidotransferase subunit B